MPRQADICSEMTARFEKERARSADLPTGQLKREGAAGVEKVDGPLKLYR